VGDPKRMAYRTVLDTLFHALIRYAAPVLVFTSEEVWGTRYPEGGSVHLLEWPETHAVKADDALIAKFGLAKNLRGHVNMELEQLRRTKEIGSSLEASVSIEFEKKQNLATLAGVDLSELLITSDVQATARDESSLPPLVEETGYGGGQVSISVSPHHKCGRCWRHLPEVTEDGTLCSRCDQVVSGMDASA
jgi:isoleucyl-tRNA synthetase